MSVAPAPLLELVDLARHFPVRNAFGRRTGWIRAVDGVSLAVWPGETLGLVGESGCGKSTLGKTVMGIHARPPATSASPAGRSADLAKRERRAIAKDLQYVYQDPGASLDPRWKVVHSLHEPLKIHTRLSRAERRGAGARDSRRGRPARRAPRPLSARAVAAASSAASGCADPDTAAAHGHPRRADLRPRRVRAGQRAQALPEPSRHLRAHLRLHLARSRRGARDVRAHRRHVPGPDRRAGRDVGRVREPRHPYTRSLLAAVPRIGGRRVTLDFALRASRRTRATCRAAAGSGRGARSSRTCARRRSRRYATSTGRLVACHFA